MTRAPTVPKSPPLRRLLAAQIPADFADWLDFVAIAALLAFHWRAEPYVFALVAVAMGLPYLVVGPFAGVLVDRSGLRTVLVASNLGRAAATACMILAPNWQALLLLILAKNAVDAFFTPAKQAAIQAMAEPDARMAVNSLSHAINQSSKIVAPAIGGALLLGLSPHEVFAVNAGLSVLAAGVLASLPAAPRPPATDEAGALFGQIRKGLAIVAGNIPLRGAFALMMAAYFGIFFYDTLIAPLTRELGFDETGFGFSMTAVGAGGVAGSLYLARQASDASPFRRIAIGLAVSGVTAAVLGGAEATGRGLSFALFLAAFAILGWAFAMAVVPVRTVIQNETPPELIARVTALSEAANMTALLTAPFIGAALASRTSIGVAFITGGVILLAGAAAAIRLSARNTGKDA